MMRQISKWLFPRLERDLQRQRINMLLFLVVAIFAIGGVVGLAIFFLNKR
jgi:hypothetical protein